MSKPGEQTGAEETVPCICCGNQTPKISPSTTQKWCDYCMLAKLENPRHKCVPSAAPVVTEPKKGAAMNIYDKDFPLQIRDIAGKPCMIIHEPGKIDIIVEVDNNQIPALNALRNLIEAIYGEN